ncbi:uncharacterized protein LOC127804423 [Diospyros lotus]|uniref:uncharacterized protein LOC127804423 n=1 Tax=Diospyros lotus TaxID=55363 RepID=UPI002256F663|nr:uncharacterized protein LOC127804423 [Diospyros lotus]
MAGDEILPQETEGKNLPTSSIDRNRSQDEAQEQEPAEPRQRLTESSGIELRRRECADQRRKMLGISDEGSDIRKLSFRQRFYKAVREREVNTVKRLLAIDSSLLRTRFTAFEANALQVAVVAGQKEIFLELMKKVDDHGILKQENTYGDTILTLAVAEGSIEIVKELVHTCVELVDIPNKNGDLPITVAALFGKEEIVDFLLDLTLEMFESNPSYGDVREEEGVVVTNSTHSSQHDDDFKVLKVSTTTQVSGHDESVNEDKDQAQPAYRSTHHFLVCLEICCGIGFPLVEFGTTVESWLVNKLEKSVTSRRLLRRICREIMESENHYEIIQKVFLRPILIAVEQDNRSFIDTIRELCPDALWVILDELYNSDMALSKDIFKIYISALKKPETGFLNTIRADRNGNTILHHAALLSSTKKLSRFPSPSLQMQSEIQWFKKVEKILPMCKGVEKRDNLIPMDLFVQEHSKLKKAGGKWLKETASSCSVVATLIITIMFSVTFTVPGSYDNDTGIPINLGSKYFTIFIISDALSLFSSCTSAMLGLFVVA